MLGKTVDGKYKLIRLLGEGGMGSVYEAEQVGSGERVAVKIINSRLLHRGGDGISRFRREAKAAGAIDSEHIVEVLDSGTDEASGLLYLVMECLAGEDLQRLIDRTGPLSPETAMRIAAQALVGLSKAHEARIVHRDIKPANIFLCRSADGSIKVKILDFGIAKIKADPLSFPHTTGLTNTEGFLGSPRYMAPEQVKNSRDVHPQTDIWALGSALYCALSGRSPYAHLTTVGDLIFAICGEAPPSVRETAPWVPEGVAEVVHGALTLELADRYPTAGAMLDAMRPHFSGDMSLSEDMLVPLRPEERAAAAPEGAAIAPAEAPHVVVNVGAVGSISGHEETQQYNPLDLFDSGPAAPPALAPLDTTSRGHETSHGFRVSAQLRATRRRKASWMAAAVAAVVVVGLGAAWTIGSLSAPPAASSSTSAASIERVRLVIAPSDASVEVDGAAVKVTGGAVEIAGSLGSSHRVRVFNGKSERMVEVFVTERGALPAKVELPPEALPKPSAVRSGALSASPPARRPTP